jgi:hypothetical protein
MKTKRAMIAMTFAGILVMGAGTSAVVNGAPAVTTSRAVTDDLSAARRGGGALAHAASRSRSVSRGGHSASRSRSVSRSRNVNRSSNVNRSRNVNRNVNVRRNVNVNRNVAVRRGGYYRGGRYYWHGWARPGRYYWPAGGAIAAGAAIGFVTAATAVGIAATTAPAPNMCWYYTDGSRTQGFWDVCP